MSHKTDAEIYVTERVQFDVERLIGIFLAFGIIFAWMLISQSGVL